MKMISAVVCDARRTVGVPCHCLEVDDAAAANDGSRAPPGLI
jgi:hypothetical protein